MNHAQISMQIGGLDHSDYDYCGDDSYGSDYGDKCNETMIKTVLIMMVVVTTINIFSIVF